MPDLDVLDLEERLTRHYADVATAPSLHRRASMGPRLAFAGLIVAVAVGIGFAVSGQNNGGDLIASPDPSEIDDQQNINPTLLRMLERSPAADQVWIEFNDLEVARTDTDTFTLEDGTVYPLSLDYGPALAQDVVTALNAPDANEQAYGFGFDDVRTSLSYSTDVGLSVALLQLNTDLSEVLDQAEADPDWADRVSRRQEGPFDIVDWDADVDFETDILRRDDVRPLGRGGQLTGFDDDLLLRTIDDAVLQTFLATNSDTETLADNAQLLDALSTIDSTNSLGFTAFITPSGTSAQATDDSERTQIFDVPTLFLIDTSIDDTSRLVLGFLPGTDLDAVDAGLREVFGSEIDLGEQFDIDPIVMTTSFTRQGDLIVIEFVPSGPEVNQATHGTIVRVARDLFIENPDLLS